MNENNKNCVELTNTDKISGAVNGIGEVNEAPVLWSERIKKLADYFTVEPFLILYFGSLNVAYIAVYQLNQEKACRVYLNNNETICKNAITDVIIDNISSEILGDTINVMNYIKAWQIPIQTTIPVILVPFVGAWSDRTGNRKVLMMMPTIGEIVSTCGLFLTTYFFGEWPLWLTALIESLPTALSGGNQVALLGALSYIADVTTAESRTFRLGMLVIVITFFDIVGPSISAILFQTVGYYGVFAIMLALQCAALSYVYFRIHNVRHEATEGTLKEKLKSFFNPYHIWDTISLVIVTPVQQRIRVILVLCAFILVQTPFSATAFSKGDYLKYRYSMNPWEIGMYQTYNTLMGAVGTAVAITLFIKYLKMHDSLLGIIGTACRIVSSIAYGLAPTRQWLFACPALNLFGNTAATALNSIGTKVVDPDKTGKMLSLFQFTEPLVVAALMQVFPKTYSNTKKTLPGAIFFLASIMMAPAIFICGILFYMHKKQERDAVVNPIEKEKYTYDNEVTAL